MPGVRDQYEDLAEATRGADLLLSHPITYAAPLLAEKILPALIGGSTATPPGSD